MVDDNDIVMDEDNMKKLESLVMKASSEQPFQERTEIGEVFASMDSDNSEPSGLSDIDFNARMSKHELSACLVFDEFKQKGLFSHDCQITRKAKRLSVSRNGLGRAEKTTIASASRSAELQGRSGGFISNMFKRRD